MENNSPLQQYGIGIYFLILSFIPLYPLISLFVATDFVSVLNSPYEIVFIIYFGAMGYGLLLGKSWAPNHVKHIYLPSAAILIPVICFFMALLNLPDTTSQFIIEFFYFLDFLLVIFVLPVALLYYFREIKGLSYPKKVIIILLIVLFTVPFPYIFSMFLLSVLS
jgi:hypothetical protein